MKLFDRRAVEDTKPQVFIGRRTYNNRQGEEKITESWYAECFHRGRTHCVTLKTKSFSVAIHRAHQLAEKIREIGIAGPARQIIELSELARQYLTMQVNRGRAPKTLTAYEYTLATLVAWANPRFNGLAEAFTEDLFWQWHRSLIDDGYAPGTRADRLIIVKQMFKWGAKKKLIPCNPLEDVKIVDPKPTPQPCFEPAQVEIILKVSADDRLEQALYATLAYAGLRFGEARAWRWINVIMPLDRPGHICISEGGSNNSPKDGETRRVPLHPELRRIFEVLPRHGDLVFYSPLSVRNAQGGLPLNQSTWLKRLKQICAKCGLENPRQYKLHTFRHAFASMCARNNVAYKYALAWMGHSSSEILDLYYKQFDDVADEAMRTIVYAATRSENKIS